MTKNKTTETEASVEAFINTLADTEQKKQDSLELLRRMRDLTGYEPRMWGPSIIGFGSYHYKYASGREGDAPLIGFSPRKAAISLYVFTGLEEQRHLLEGLGKFKMGKACIYIKKLSDINLVALQKIMQATINFLEEKYAVN
jgi:hypothetical protein